MIVKSENNVSQFEILDLTGKSLIRIIPENNEFTVKMSGLKGIYLVRMIMDSGEIHMKKVVKY
jgi:hypothetical protein